MNRRTLCLLLATLLLTACGATKESVTRSIARKVNTVGKATGNEVPLTADEVAVLRSVFGEGLDTEKLKMIVGSPVATGAPKTVESTIYYDPKHDVTDPTYRRTGRFVKLLAHESTHVWQFQNKGAAYIPDSLFNQGVHAVVNEDRNRAYRYTLDATKPFSAYNAEQQAQIVEEYVGLAAFGFVPGKCDNFGDLGVAGFREAAEAVLKSGLNATFDGIDMDATTRIVTPGG